MLEHRIGIKDGRKQGWHWADNKIIDVHGAKLGPYGLAIYYALCRHADQNGKSWPSYATLARETGMSRKQAINTIKRLVDLELVGRQDRKNKAGASSSNFYILLEVKGGSEPRTLPVVNHVHQGSESRTPKQEPLNVEPIEEESTKTDVDASLFDESTDRRREHVDSPLSDKEKVLRDFGVLGPIVTQIAESHDLYWIRQAIMKVREPGGVVHFHQVGWMPALAEQSDELQRAADPGLDRVQPFFDVYKRFPDPYELLEFEAALDEEYE